MLFLLATPEYTTIQSNTTKVRVHLRNGVAEIYEQHQDLMGKVENNLVEIETSSENRTEKLSFVLQDAVFIVSNQGLDNSSDYKGTSIYIYAKKSKDIGLSSAFEEISKEYEQKKILLDSELEKLSLKENSALEKIINSKILLLQEDVEFLKKSLAITKDSKK
jgi:hypothetical protein